MSDKPREQNEYKVAIGNLKRALKERGITYREIAEGIGLSESGIKKIFLASDGSFQRLTQICRFIGVTLQEILEDSRIVDVGFSEKQQRDFLAEPLLFQFYWMLVYERRSVEVIKDELKLGKAEAFRISRKLDTLGLIKLLTNDRLRLPSIKAVRWQGDGEFVRNIYRKWSRSLIEELAKPHPQKDELFALRYFQMTPKTYTEFTEALRSLEHEFTRRSIYEMRSQPSSLLHVRWLAAADNRSFVTNRRLSELP